MDLNFAEFKLSIKNDFILNHEEESTACPKYGNVPHKHHILSGDFIFRKEKELSLLDTYLDFNIDSERY